MDCGGVSTPGHGDMHPKSWTVIIDYLYVLSSVLHRTQSV